MKPKNKEQLVREPKTSGYKSTPYHWGWQLRDMPPFTFIVAQAMQLDPTVRLGLAMRAAPLCQVEFAYQEGDDWKQGIEASDPHVAAFVERNIKRIWKDYIKGLLDSQRWGWAGAEVLYKHTSSNTVEVGALLHRRSNDVRVITSGGMPAGVRFLNVKGANQDRVDLCFPYCLWVPFRPEPGEFYGVSIMKGAQSPWWDKWQEGGALDVRRLFMHKDAYGGVDVSYPEGYTEIPSADGSTSTPVPNRDIAREMAEQIKAGGVTSRPTDRDEKGNDRWTITRATVPSNPAHILNYPKDLDTEILRGLEIPDDVLESTDGAGGAWAGKTVPQGAFYTGLELWLRDIIVCIKTQVMDHLVRLNFGPGHWYEITTKPLSLQATEQQGKDKQPQQPAFTFGPQNDPLRMSLEAIGRGAIQAEPFVRVARKAAKVKTNGTKQRATPAGGKRARSR